MKQIYWKGTTVRVSRFRLWLFSLVVPREVRESWYRHETALEKDLFESRQETAKSDKWGTEIYSQLIDKESRHERDWRTQAFFYSGIDLINDPALSLARAAYKEGIGYREFLDYYRRAWGVQQWKIINNLEWAKDVVREINREEEDGSSPLTNLLDKASENALDQGSLAVWSPELGISEEEAIREASL